MGIFCHMLCKITKNRLRSQSMANTDGDIKSTEQYEFFLISPSS